MNETLIQLLDSWREVPRPRTDLACQLEPILWFSDKPSELEQAKALCRPCPLRASCLAGALERGEPHGVWGGEILQEGAIIAIKRSRGRPRKYPLPRDPMLCTSS